MYVVWGDIFIQGGKSNTSYFGILRSYPKKKKGRKRKEKKQDLKNEKKPFLEYLPLKILRFRGSYFQIKFCGGGIFVQGGKSNTPNFGILRSYPEKKRKRK